MNDIEKDPEFRALLSGNLGYIGAWGTTEPTEHAEMFSVVENVTGISRIVDIHTISSGWQKLLRLERIGAFTHCGGKGTRIQAIEIDRQFGGAQGLEIDRCIADAVVQMGLFGELRYGGYIPDIT